MVNIIKNSKFKKGFTLIELLVVIAIIGILATFIVASFASAQARGRDARRKADLEAIQTALELFKSDSRGAAFYPVGPEGAPLIGALAPPPPTPVYIKIVPTDPSDSSILYEYAGGSLTGGACPAPNGNSIITATCDDYRITATLENLNDPEAAGTTLIAGSAARCPHQSFTVPAYTAATYVVCGN